MINESDVNLTISPIKTNWLVETVKVSILEFKVHVPDSTISTVSLHDGGSLKFESVEYVVPILSIEQTPVTRNVYWSSVMQDIGLITNESALIIFDNRQIFDELFVNKSEFVIGSILFSQPLNIVKRIPIGINK